MSLLRSRQIVPERTQNSPSLLHDALGVTSICHFRIVAPHLMPSALDQRIYELRSLITAGSHDPVQLASWLRELALRLVQANQADQAFTMTEQALQVLVEARLEHIPLFSILRLDYADRIFALGRINESLPLYQAALARLLTTHGSNAEATWAARERIGVTARSLGDFNLARQELTAVLDFRRQNLNETPATIRSLVVILLEMAILGRISGRGDLAAQYIAEASDRTRKLGDDELLADVLEQLGALATKQREFGHALNFYQTVYRIRLARLGAAHPKTLHCLTSIGEVHALEGRLEEARATLEHARSHPTQAALDRTLCDSILAGVLFRQKDSTASVQGFDVALAQFESMNHRQRAMVSRDAVFVALRAGQITRAVQHAHASLNAAFKLWDNILAYGSEADRLGWQSITDVFSACAAVATHDAYPVVRAVLGLKGVVIDSLSEDRESVKGSPLKSALDEARTRLRQIELSPNRTEAELAASRAAVDQLESRNTIAVRSVDSSTEPAHIDPAEILSRLQEDQVLVDYIRFRDITPENQWVPQYGAVVATRKLGWHWIQLGRADGESGLDACLARLNECLRARLPPRDDTFLAASNQVYERLWQPVQAVLTGEVLEVVVSPDSQINLLAFSIQGMAV